MMVCFVVVLRCGGLVNVADRPVGGAACGLHSTLKVPIYRTLCLLHQRLTLFLFRKLAHAHGRLQHPCIVAAAHLVINMWRAAVWV